MESTETLVHEHDIIKRAIRLLEKANSRLRAGDDEVASVYPKLVDFIRHFADESHHGKEEDILFELLVERGVPRENSPLEIIFTEHEKGRDYVREIDKATSRFLNGDKSARADIIANSAGYARLLRDHIHKEDEVLYPMADKILSSDDQRKLEMGFHQVEERFGRARQLYYEDLVAKLEQELR